MILLWGVGAAAGLWVLSRRGRSTPRTGVVSEGAETLSDGTAVRWRVVRTAAGYEGQFARRTIPGFAPQWIRASSKLSTEPPARAAAIAQARALDWEGPGPNVVLAGQLDDAQWRVLLEEAGYLPQARPAAGAEWTTVAPHRDSPEIARLLVLEFLGAQAGS